MQRISHRELRNSSSQILARTLAGEQFAVTNNGEVAAILSPPGMRGLERARAAGQIRQADTSLRAADIPRITLDTSSQVILDDLRGDR